MCRFSQLSLILALALAVGACSDQTSPLPTQVPPPAFALTDACDGELAKQISSEQNSLFKAAQLTEAKKRFTVIAAGCPGTKQEMLDYVRFTIANLAFAMDPNKASPPTRDEAMVAHWNSLFVYVGLPAPGEPAAVLSAGGAAKVCDADVECDVRTGDLQAELLVAANSTIGRHLYTLYKRSDGCFATNLDKTGPCFQVDANPHVTVFSPMAKVGICQAVTDSEVIPGLAPALAHLETETVSGQPVTTTRLTLPLGAPFPAFCADVAANDVGPRLQRLGAIGRLASAALDFVRPTTLYAGHGGLGGSTLVLSPFGGVDRYIFKATFSTPLTTPTYAADKGTFDVVTFTPPGMITIEPSLGDPLLGLNDEPIVLSQGGGNCTQCGGLMLRGVVTTSTAGQSASYGTYVVSWQSLQDKPTLKAAPFVLRGGDLAEIARLAYETRNNQRVLTYNGVVLTSRTWTQHVAQTFEIFVDLDAKTTSLRIDGTAVPEAQGKPFVAAATNLTYFAAEFTGIDAGTVGLDNLGVLRYAQADQQP